MHEASVCVCVCVCHRLREFVKHHEHTIRQDGVFDVDGALRQWDVVGFEDRVVPTLGFRTRQVRGPHTHAWCDANITRTGTERDRKRERERERKARDPRARQSMHGDVG